MDIWKTLLDYRLEFSFIKWTKDDEHFGQNVIESLLLEAITFFAYLG